MNSGRKCRSPTASLSSTISPKNFSPHALLNTEEGQDIGLSYLKERGFREEIIEKFQLGYAPEQRDAFVKEAIGQSIQSRIAGEVRIGGQPQ